MFPRTKYNNITLIDEIMTQNTNQNVKITHFTESLRIHLI